MWLLLGLTVCVRCVSLFEIFMALTLQGKEGSGCKLEIIMPPSEEASFRKTLLRVRAAVPALRRCC